VVSGVIGSAAGGGSLPVAGIAMILGKAIAFLAGALVLGLTLSRRLFGLASKLHGRGVLLASALVFCFALASLASAVGLAPIVGAYAAGLILEDAHFRGFTDKGIRELETLVHPISSVLAPVFFVLMGMRVELTAFAHGNVLGLAALLTLAAVIGKQACALGVGRSRLNRLAIGIGMTPRGEVGIIFANIGLALSIGGQPVVDEGTFSAVMIMVIVTTIVTPPALKWSFARGERVEASG
jgi:Kef-type K+ transport system membrane component KefB